MNAPIPPLVPIQPNVYRLVQLPAALSPHNRFTLAPLVRRNQISSVRAKLWLGRNFAFTGDPPESFFELTAITQFAFHGRITRAIVGNELAMAFSNDAPPSLVNDPLPLISQVTIQLDGPDQILPELFDFDALANSVLMFAGDEIFSLSASTLTGPGAYTLTAIRSRLGTPQPDHANGEEIFIIGLADLTLVQHPLLAAGNTARFKLTIGMQHPSDVDAGDQLL
jgi:hypothetical protein